MTKEKLKERKQLIRKSKSEEFRFQKTIKRDRKRTEEDKKKRNEDNCLDENESIKKQRKSRKNSEQTAFASGEGARKLKEKHIQTDKLSGGKQQESTDNSAALDGSGGSNLKEKSDSFSSGKKKWEEEKDNHFFWSSAKMKTSVHKHDENGKKTKKNHKKQSVRGDELEVSLKSDLEIVCVDDNFDSTKKRKRKAEKECTRHIGKSENKGIEVLVGHYQVSERTDIVKKKKRKNDNNNDNVDNSIRKRKRKAEPEEKFFLDIENSDNDQVSEEIEAVKKKKNKKSNNQPEEKSKPAVHPGVRYLHTWHKDRQNWNFKKVRQVWLLQNMFDQEQISNEDFYILLKYLEGLKGAAKDKTIEMAEQRIESGTGEQDAVVESRVRQVLQLLTE